MAESAPVTTLPDVLVLGVGGTLGEAWLRGLLNGLESASGLDFRRCESFVGSSAGSIVAASLAAGRRPEAGDRAAREWGEAAAPEPGRSPGLVGRAARRAGRLGVAAATPFAPVALAGVAPAGRAVRAAALRASPSTTRSLRGLGRQLESLGARFDGRLRISAVDRKSGRRVMFGAPGAPPAEVAQAVLASCAVPWVFAPVRIGGREYVDGGVWSPTNLDAAPAGRGSSVLCLVPTALEGGIAGMRAFSLAAVAAETLAVRSRGAEVRTIAPDAASAALMGRNLMDPSRSEAVLDAAFAQGRALAG
jgi:NTE family protein